MSAIYNWTVNQGETATLLYTRTDASNAALPFNSNTQFRMKVKTSYTESASVVDNQLSSGWFDLNPTDLPSADQGNHNVRFSISASVTASLNAPATFVYDIEAVSGNIVERILEGSFITRPEVTS